MGIYERDYYRPEGAAASMSMTTTLVLANVGLFLLNMLLGQQFFGGSLFDWMTLTPDVFRQPWRLYELVTYGFTHDPNNLSHIIFNMLVLWCFGREIESIYGRREFLRLYLVAIALGGIAFVIPNVVMGQARVVLYGASAGVMAVVMLFVLHFPKRTILLMGVIPTPAWVLGVLYLVMDISGAMGSNPGDHTAHGSHLAGAAWAFAYYRSGMNLGSWLPRDWQVWKWRPKPSLRVHDPEAQEAADDRDFQQQVDDILAKIHRSGEGSLTRQERQTLERASRRYQRRRRG